MVDIVTYEVAVKLKEKGFNWICSHYYRTKCKDLFKIFPCEDWSDIKDRINAPTIAQVLKWLREEKSIYVVPCVIDDCDTDADFRIINRFTFWSFDIQIIETADYIYAEYTNIGSKRFDFYEEAALAGIEYVLDNLI